ncbi:hypothetical protein HCN44_009995 [Aphidius gifuensis]|nr:hypothetical protein HCN44_009995 [Aphidius gifuensis]
MSKEKKEKTMSLRERMLKQLRSARFRYLNETLYNNNSSESKKLFVEDPDAFEAYHSGYRQQVKQWPLNPLEVIINTIKKIEILKIADVESRFENIKEFVKSLEKYGFQNTYQDLSNKLFYYVVPSQIITPL